MYISSRDESGFLDKTAMVSEQACIERLAEVNRDRLIQSRLAIEANKRGENFYDIKFPWVHRAWCVGVKGAAK